jgi:hypothetical protein
MKLYNNWKYKILHSYILFNQDKCDEDGIGIGPLSVLRIAEKSRLSPD